MSIQFRHFAQVAVTVLMLGASPLRPAPVDAAHRGATLGGVFLASGNPRFPCREALRLHRRLPGPVYHATLWGTFGYSTRCWRRVFALPRAVTIEFYASSEPTRRRDKMTWLDFMPALSVAEYDLELRRGSPVLRRNYTARAAAVLSFCEEARKENDKCLFSICLECTLSDKAAARLVEWAADAGWKRADIVFNPARGRTERSALGAGVFESHNWLLDAFPAGASRIVTLDGIDSHLCDGPRNRDQISAADVREWIRRNQDRVRYLGAWCPLWQGLGGRGYVEPHRRDFRVSRGSINRFVETMRTAI